MTRLVALTLCALLCLSPVRAQVALSSETDLGNANRAYADLVTRFWEGPAATGRLTLAATGLPIPSGLTARTANCIGCYWGIGMGINALYAHWKLNGSADALTRLKAVWRWTQATISLANAGTCGPIAGSNGTAQDDIAWNANAYLQLYEASGDANALAYAKAALDCAWGRWYDTSIGGGLWYDDSRTCKTSYQGPYAVAALRYSQLTPVSADQVAYLARAVSLEASFQASLTISRTDALYWVNVADDGSGAPVFAGGNPCSPRTVSAASYQAIVGKAASSTFLAGNMAIAALDAMLANAPGVSTAQAAAYRARAVATAQSIYGTERIGAVLMNDRDAFTNGWAAYHYVTQVLPLLPATGAADAKTILATARSVMRNARNADATYSGDWDGPPIKWSASPAYGLDVSSNAVIWPIVAASLPGATR